jgi:hypothetical protein
VATAAAAAVAGPSSAAAAAAGPSSAAAAPASAPAPAAPTQPPAAAAALAYRPPVPIPSLTNPVVSRLDPNVTFCTPAPPWFDYIFTSVRRTLPAPPPSQGPRTTPQGYLGCACTCSNIASGSGGSNAANGNDGESCRSGCFCMKSVRLGLWAIQHHPDGPDAVLLLVECGECTCRPRTARPLGRDDPPRRLACRPTQGGVAFRVEVKEARGEKGRGLFAAEAIPKGRFVLEYAGEVLSLGEAKVQLRRYDDARRRSFAHRAERRLERRRLYAEQCRRHREETCEREGPYEHGPDSDHYSEERDRRGVNVTPTEGIDEDEALHTSDDFALGYESEPGADGGHALLSVYVHHARMVRHGAEIKEERRQHGGGTEASCSNNNKPPRAIGVAVDATVRGNAARFINHSCQPNLGAVLVRGRGHFAGDGGSAHNRGVPFRIALFSRREIRKGQELTMSYAGSDEASGEGLPLCRTPCECGAARCRGWLPVGA